MSFTLESNLTDFKYNNTRTIIPFLLERKYCYNTPDSRDGTSKSFYKYLDHEIKPNIEKIYGGNFIEPNTGLKILVNKFSDYIFDKLNSLNAGAELLDTSMSNSKNFFELKKEKTKNINMLNEELNLLNNNNYKDKRTYQNTHFLFNYYKFCINLIINSILFIAVIFCIYYLSNSEQAILSKNLGFYLNIAMIIIFAFYLILNLNNAELRNKRNWNQIYFKNMSNTADTV
tara:strand:+ start:1205 stop:1894 length:690 start_codon:yes stop_codon:yes gene_type:complete